MTTQPTILLDNARIAQALRRDPSRSGKLRAVGRGRVNRRVYELSKQLRQALHENDAANLTRYEQMPASYMPWLEPRSSVLTRAEQMVQGLTENILENPPDWLADVIASSVARGVQQAGEELRLSVDQVDYWELGRFHGGATIVEIRGTSAETQRRIMRNIVQALTFKQNTSQLMREVRRTLERITRLRLITLVNTAVVRAVNAGKLLAYKQNGVRRVGVEPEWIPGFMRKHDARLRDAMVNVLTAGDDNVCEDCEDIAGDGPYDIDDAEDLIPAHPNCRCAFVPADDERFAEIEERLEREREEEEDRSRRRRRRDDDED